MGNITHATTRTAAITNSYRYEAFGARTPQAPATAGRYGYTGEENDAETGLVYLRARYYDPALGRFISPDPFLGRLAEPITQNRYVYVKNNPLGFTDPSGNDAFTYLCSDCASGMGHVGAVVGNEKFGYYYFSQGAAIDPANPPSNFSLLFTSNTPAGVDMSWGANLQDINLGHYQDQYNVGRRNITTEAQDLEMIIKGLTIAQSSGGYNLVTNQCATTAASILGAGGIQTSWRITPNAWYSGWQ